MKYTTIGLLMLGLLIVACEGTATDMGLFYKGYFSEFQKNILDRTGCYTVTQGIYSDVSIMVDHLLNFTMHDLPIIVSSCTKSLQVFVDHDDVCQITKTVTTLFAVLKNPTLLVQRLDFMTLITVVGNIQQGLKNKDYLSLGKGVGKLTAKALNFIL